MFWRVKQAEGATIQTEDGIIGKVEQFYLDDESWTIRYLIVDTGFWLFGRKVLISPLSVKSIDLETGTISLNLTKDKVRNSPDIDTQKPVSRLEEINFYNYYGWPYYWGGSGIWGAGRYPASLYSPVVPEYPDRISAFRPDLRMRFKVHEQNDDTHLRSTKELEGYDVHARGGDIGRLNDLFVDERSWEIRYAMVETGSWLSSRKLLIDPAWIERISWADATIYMNLDRNRVFSSPEFSGPEIDRDYEKRLYSHYDQTPHWKSGHE
jgi:uncharacterized protein YrrD